MQQGLSPLDRILGTRDRPSKADQLTAICPPCDYVYVTYQGDAREDAHMAIVTLKAMILLTRTLLCHHHLRDFIRNRWNWASSSSVRALSLGSQTKVGDRMSEGFGVSTRIDLWSAAPLLYLWSSHKASSGLTSPSPSHYKPQLRPVAISPVGVPELSATAAPCITTQDTDRITKGFMSPDFLYGSRFAFSAWVLKYLVTPIMRPTMAYVL